MAESVMEQARKTWLKDECFYPGYWTLAIVDDLQFIQRRIFEGGEFMVDVALDVLQKALKSKVDSTYITEGVSREIYNRARNAAIHKSNQDFIDLILYCKTIAFEKVVECQCGKPKPLITHSRRKL